MPDYGQKATDAEFRRLRAKINDVYRQAYKEIEQKGREFAQAHARREAQMRQMVADGKMTQADFDAWMRGQVFQGEQWQKKKQQMADTLYHADQVAQQMVNDSRFNVFAANANYMGYALEHDAGIKTNFGLYDADSVRRLVKKEPDLLPPKKHVGKDKSYQWYNRQVQTAITQGIIQGESLDKIAHRIGKQTGETNASAMLRNARTMQTGAQNAGRIEGLHQAQELGIKVKKQWMATLDSHTRDAHADLDGQIVDVDEPFDSELGPIMYPGDPDADPANVWNCFIGQTKVASDSEIVRSYKHDYSGELFVIKTARGVEFTCTPNHPILTPRGWIGANRLHEGDNILVAGIGDLDVLGIDPDVNHVFSRFDTLHELFKETFGERATGLSVDFHGDRATANVEIVSKERFLMDNGNASSGEMGDKLQLKHSAALVLTKRHFVPGLRRVHITALRLMRRTGKPLSLFGRGLSHAIKHGFRTVPRGDTAILEPKRDGMSGDVQFLGQSLDGFPGQILVDDIVNINITTVSHIPVFNLQTRNGYYFVNDIIAQNREKCNGYFAIAHNCRCTLVYVYPEYPNSMERRDNETGENVGDMTYREWEEMKRGEEAEPIDIPEQARSTVVDGSDISETWQRRPDQFDFEINDVIDAQGFDGNPRVVDADEFDRAVQESGFIAQRSYSAPDQETLDAYREQLYNGDWYVDCGTGGAQYGQGMYCAADYTGTLSDGIQAEMDHYRHLGESRNVTQAREMAYENAWNEAINEANDLEKAFIRDEYFHDATLEQRRMLRRISDEELDALCDKYNPIAEIATAARDSANGVSYTETLTLTPDAKIVTWREINDIRTGTLDIKYRNEVLEEELKRRGLSGDELTFARYNAGLGVSWNEVDAAARRLGAEKRNAVMEQLEDAGNTAQRRFNEEQERRRERARIYQEKYHDIGSLAAALGYDAINAENHGQSGSYTVILNRTKVIFRRP